MEKTNEEKKMTLEEYQQKYTHPENVVAAKNILLIVEATIGIAIAVCLFFVVLKIFELHQTAGYVSIAVSVLIFIFLYIVPVVKLRKTKSFMTNIKATSAHKAKKYNKELREEISDKMIGLAAQTDVKDWYSEELIGKLAIARHRGNDKELKSVLTTIYQTDVKNAANRMIMNSAVKVGITTAASQSQLIDTLFVIVFELSLIKNIVYLYGYRPTDSQMVKIYKSVIVNALIAYGISSATIGLGKTVGSGITSALEKVSKSGNFFASTIGSIAGIAIESGIQLVANSTLTVLIGNQTKKYLIKEYNLQEALDNVELIDNEEEVQLIESVKEELKKKMPKKMKDEKPEFVSGF